MQRVLSVKAGGPFTITELGRLMAETAPPCQCELKLVGLLLECPNCGTVYGNMRETGPWSSQAWNDKR